MCRNHDYRSFGGQISDLIRLTCDLDFILKRELIAKDRLDSFDSGCIEQARKTIGDDTPRKLVMGSFEIGSYFLCISGVYSMQNLLICLKSLCLIQRKVGIYLKQGGSYIIPKLIFIIRIYCPRILLNSKLFTVKRGFQLLFQDFLVFPSKP